MISGLRALEPDRAAWWAAPVPGAAGEVAREFDRLARLVSDPAAAPALRTPARLRAAVCGMCSRRVAVAPCPAQLPAPCVLRDYPALVLRTVQDALADADHAPAD